MITGIDISALDIPAATLSSIAKCLENKSLFGLTNGKAYTLFKTDKLEVVWIDRNGRYTHVKCPTADQFVDLMKISLLSRRTYLSAKRVNELFLHAKLLQK